MLQFVTKYFFRLLLLAVLIALAMFYPTPAGAVDVKTYVPVNAKKYLPTLKQQVQQYFADFPDYSYFGGLIEQESCIALTWKSCWNPTTKLDTKREYGAGLGQLTKAYNSEGQIRFDSLNEIRRLHHAELEQLSWGNILQRPDLQMRAIVLMTRDNFKRLYMIKDPYQRMAFADSAYNGGLGGVYQDRRLCGLSSNCDPQVWFDNVEKTCTKSKQAIYGNRSPCQINREHVSNVLELRMNKYTPYLSPDKTADFTSQGKIIIKEKTQAPVAIVKPVVSPVLTKPVVTPTLPASTACPPAPKK